MTEAPAEIIDPPAPVAADPPPADPAPPAPPADPPAGDPPSTWGDDWRDKMAGGDETITKALSRYNTPAGVAKALAVAQRTISEGKINKPVEKPADPTDAKAMAEWRKANSIPDEPTGYKLPDAVTKALTDADKPVLASFTEFAHAKGARPDVIEIASEWYVENQRAIAEAQAAEDGQYKDEAEDKLRAEWGGEYKGNFNLAKRFLDESPMSWEGWAGIRGPDGRKFGDSPDFMNWATELARAKFGDGVFASADAATKHDNRRAEIEKIRDTDFARYENEGLDKEMRAIIEKDLARKK